MKCWIITEGMAGTENQCIGVAEALGAIPDIHHIRLNEPWKTFSPYLKFERESSFDPILYPPWPDLLIASGRKSIAPSRYIRKASGGKTFTVQIQDPRISPSNFDLVAVPEHDPTRGENVIVTAASPNRITDEKLIEAKSEFSLLGELKSPCVAVLIGGTSKAHKLTPEIMRTLVSQIKDLDAGLMITTSRRTGEENTWILNNEMVGRPDTYVWDGQNKNPYFGMLAWADYIIVTSDSASMLSDAATTGKPVYVVNLEGGGTRLDKLHENLKNRGIARNFEGKLEKWSYEPLRDSANIAGEIRKRLAGHMGRPV